MTDTKEKILDTAERLIGEQGYAATSLRQIIAEAGVNLAAVHYHFGSKEDLLDAVVVRKVTPVNEARMAWLERVEAEAGRRPPGGGEGAGILLPADGGSGQPQSGIRALDGTNAGGRHDAADRGEAFPGDGPAFRGRAATRGAGFATGRTDVAGPFHGGRDGAHDVPRSDLSADGGGRGGHGTAHEAAGDIPERGLSRAPQPRARRSRCDWLGYCCARRRWRRRRWN